MTVLLIFVLVNNILIYRHVRTTLVRSVRHSTNATTTERRLRQVEIQCFLYTTAFWATTLPTLLDKSLERAEFSVHEESYISHFYWCRPLPLLRRAFQPARVCTTRVPEISQRLSRSIVPLGMPVCHFGWLGQNAPLETMTQQWPNSNKDWLGSLH